MDNERIENTITMNKKKQYKIALVLYTQGIDYDDRIRKEMLSIMKLHPNVSFKIFAVEPKNREEEGVSSYGVPYRIPYLKTRDKYVSAIHTIAKAWDFYKTIRKDLKEFDAIWCADVETFIFVFMLRGKPLAWDLHELPERFMYNPLWKMLFRMMERKVDVMVHANEPRLKYLESIGLVRHPEKQFFLRNFPDFNEMDAEYDETYHQFDQWLGSGKCVYLQGIVNNTRADVESIESVLAYPELKGVVVGKIQPDRMMLLENRFGKDELYSRIFFTGRIKQLKTPQYIRRCAFSLIFYKNTSINNWYCEPNRMFQNVINGNPVIVGNNPPMKDFVENGRYGVVVNTDGSDVAEIKKGIQQLLTNYDTFKTNVTAKKCGMWSEQEGTIRQIAERFLN